MKTLALNEEFTLLFPLKSVDTSTVSNELKGHHYDFSIRQNANDPYPTLYVQLHDFAHAQLVVGLVLSLITEHNDILEYLKELDD